MNSTNVGWRTARSSTRTKDSPLTLLSSYSSFSLQEQTKYTHTGLCDTRGKVYVWWKMRGFSSPRLLFHGAAFWGSSCDTQKRCSPVAKNLGNRGKLRAMREQVSFLLSRRRAIIWARARTSVPVSLVQWQLERCIERNCCQRDACGRKNKIFSFFCESFNWMLVKSWKKAQTKSVHSQA